MVAVALLVEGFWCSLPAAINADASVCSPAAALQDEAAASKDGEGVSGPREVRVAWHVNVCKYV